MGTESPGLVTEGKPAHHTVTPLGCVQQSFAGPGLPRPHLSSARDALPGSRRASLARMKPSPAPVWRH